jgi:O-antigen/teichoic acid export membrane protein
LIVIAAASTLPAAGKKRRSLQADTLAASVIILLVATVVQRTIGFGRSIVFCRWLSPEALGEWELTYSFLMLAAPLAVLGVPGSFGRYAEHYRQRGHLRTFVHRAAAWTAACTVTAVGMIMWFAPELSQLMFGRAEETSLVRGIGLCLGTVIMQNTLTSLLAALRLYRIVTALNFVQSLLFAMLSLGMLWSRPSIASIVWGYAIASLVASAGALAWAWPALRHLEPAPHELPHGEFWQKLMRFALFVWATNLLTNLFAVIDRYMLVHYAGLSPAEALEQVGHYHTSRVVPLLLVSVTELLTGLLMPHLSHDWEAGQRELAGSRLNLAVKLTSAGMLFSGALVLAAGPILFGVVLQGRFDAGLAVLPWTLVGCVWYGVYLIAQNYLWCAEKTWLAVAPLVLGLAANVLLNFVLLPSYGLQGAVVAIAIATALVLAMTIALSARHGMSVDMGTWTLVTAPAALGLGVWAAWVACALVAVVTLGTNLVLTAGERRELKTCVVDALKSLAGPLARGRRIELDMT